MDTNQFADGLHGLRNPVQPLIRIVQFLYLTGPFTTIAEVLAELQEPIETNAIHYPDPREALSPFLSILQEFERLKDPGGAAPPYRIFDQENTPVDGMEAMNLRVSHQIICRELEQINSQLCGPCGCALCCVGPGRELRQDFFEIPLSAKEAENFPLPAFDTWESRQTTPYADTILQVHGRPFYEGEPTLLHWQTGWSLILPKEQSCPHLEPTHRSCQIYPQRPEVCRRPQIFSYLLERRPQDNAIHNGQTIEAFTWQNRLLAIWDCPYVKQFQAEIAAYAELCEMEPIFKKNKE